eukprot:350193-Chlamydomonas_euryale.AAC.8
MRRAVGRHAAAADLRVQRRRGWLNRGLMAGRRRHRCHCGVGVGVLARSMALAPPRPAAPSAALRRLRPGPADTPAGSVFGRRRREIWMARGRGQSDGPRVGPCPGRGGGRH